MTKKQKLHTEMMELANIAYGSTMMFAAFCISHDYYNITTKEIKKVIRQFN